MDNRHAIGGNNPPEPTPYEAARAKVAEARDEAAMWLDGAAVTSQEQADGLAQLLDMARKAGKQADDARKIEAAPFDAGKDEVQARYKPVITEAERVADTLKTALGRWLAKVDADQRAAAAAKQAEAQRLADEARAKHAAANPVNLAEREAADAAIERAERAQRIADAAQKATATAKSVTGAKAVGLRTYYRADVTDPAEFARYLWRNHNAEYLLWLATVAGRMVAESKSNMPGVIAVPVQKAV